MKPILPIGVIALFLSFAACRSAPTTGATPASEPRITPMSKTAIEVEQGAVPYADERRSTKPEVRYYVIADT